MIKSCSRSANAGINCRKRTLPFTLLSVVFLLHCGCEKADKIQVYTVPKHQKIQKQEFLEEQALQRAKSKPSAPVPKRMIGVIIPKDPELWFLKLEGNVEAVAAREGDLREFLKSLSFTESNQIEWKRPPDWEQLPANAMRYATLVLDGKPRLEISVTKLPLQRDKELEQQILDNVNRWRGQLTLEPIPLGQLNTETERINLKDAAAVWVNMVGESVPNQGMGMGLPAAHPPVERNRAEEPGAAATPKYELPKEWQEAPATPFAAISLQVVEGDQKVAITVTPARGNKVDNVNRWRGQLKLEPLDADQLSKSAKQVAVKNLTGDLFELSNDGRAIYGVIVEGGHQMWFIKLFGDSVLAEREKPRFELFLKTLELN